MIRHSILEIKEILSLLKRGKCSHQRRNEYKEINGVMVKITSDRYVVFQGNLQCVKCGIKGRYFAIEKHNDFEKYHLNLYAINENGEEILMTKDHIIPVSKKGRNHISNYQTMCYRCNTIKGNGDNKGGEPNAKKLRALENIRKWKENHKEQLLIKYGYNGEYPVSNHNICCHTSKLFIGEYGEKTNSDHKPFVGIKCYACGMTLGLHMDDNNFYVREQFNSLEKYKLALLTLVIKMWNSKLTSKEFHKLREKRKEYNKAKKHQQVKKS